MAGSADLSVLADSTLSYVTAIPLPDQINGDTLVWHMNNWNFDSSWITPVITYLPDSNLQSGEFSCLDAWVTLLATDSDSSNNEVHHCAPVGLGFVSNDKQVFPVGECTPNYVGLNQKLTYTLRFQNSGPGTAINIYILDSLDASLDLSTSCSDCSSELPPVSSTRPPTSMDTLRLPLELDLPCLSNLPPLPLLL